MLQELFAPVPKTTGVEKSNFRTFEGDGTSFLKIPGLKKVKAVRIGGTEIPLFIRESYPVNLVENLPSQEEHDVPLIKQDRLDDGTPILIRSVKSNDGFWQKGLQVQVDGEWEKDAEVASDTGKANPTGPVGKAVETSKGTNGHPTEDPNADGKTGDPK